MVKENTFFQSLPNPATMIHEQMMSTFQILQQPEEKIQAWLAEAIIKGIWGKKGCRKGIATHTERTLPEALRGGRIDSGSCDESSIL